MMLVVVIKILKYMLVFVQAKSDINELLSVLILSGKPRHHNNYFFVECLYMNIISANCCLEIQWLGGNVATFSALYVHTIPSAPVAERVPTAEQSHRDLESRHWLQ